MQRTLSRANPIAAIAAAFMVCLLLVFPTWMPGYVARMWSAAPSPGGARAGEPASAARLPASFYAVAGDGDPFRLSQLATATAATLPAATTASPPGTAQPVATQSPSQPTRVPPLSTLTLAGSPTLAGGVAPTLPMATQPAAGATVSVATRPAPAGAVTAALGPLSPTALPIASVTPVLAGGQSAPTTYTARVAAPTGSLLDRLIRNKPGVWGSKALYVGLAFAYTMLLGLVLRFVFRVNR